MLLRTRRRRAIENDSLHRAQLLCSISDDPEQVSYFVAYILYKVIPWP